MEARNQQVARRRLALAFALLLSLAVPTSVATDGTLCAERTLRLPPRDLDDGDIVFRTGVDAVGRVVLNYGERPRFSHVGMVVRMNGETLIAHALPRDMEQGGGVQLQRLAAFSSPLHASDIGYYRLQGLTAAQRTEIRRYLLTHVGTPFDYRFQYSNDEALYCTELVLKALALAGVDLAGTLEPVRIMTVDEPAFAPDALRRSEKLQELIAAAS